MALTPSRKCLACHDKSNAIKSLVNRLNSLTIKANRVRQAERVRLIKRASTTFTWRKITSDAKTNFYTGITTIKSFNAIFLLLQPYLPALRYWRGPKVARSWSKVKRHFKQPASKKLSHRDEFLLTLMRLRLGLLNEDLADRFNISTTVCSNTFTTWIRLLSKVLGDALVVWIPREAIRENFPEVFKKTGHYKCRVIIDCSEVSIEHSKRMDQQATTWSDYKHHNTFKFLIGISPSGFITFLSDCYGGRATDKFITMDNGFFENLERDDEVMTDKGFNIKEELLMHNKCSSWCSCQEPIYTS